MHGLGGPIEVEGLEEADSLTSTMDQALATVTKIFQRGDCCGSVFAAPSVVLSCDTTGVCCMSSDVQGEMVDRVLAQLLSHGSNDKGRNCDVKPKPKLQRESKKK